ncbi:MAG TPA: ABC transporter permease [Opitutaceae bacterium]|nr:ABC transporter permease [Opitutaceae bacterium]HND62397.1 ABC transporter permease [Opitutaceae bacterium]
MNWRNIITVYQKELKDSLRDRRTLLSTIIIPTLVIPLLMFGVGKAMSTIISRAKEEIPTVAIIGGADSPTVVAALKKAPKLRVVAVPADWKQAISDKKLRAAVEIPAGFEAGLKAGAAPTVRVYNYSGELKSDFGARAVEQVLTDLRERTVVARLAERGLPKTVARPFEFQRENVAPPEKVGGNLFGGIVPYLIIILCFSGAMYPAMDLTAGEKERGTMETLLCSPVAREDLVFGKFLMVLTGSLSAMCFMLLSMGTTAAIGGSLMMSGGGTVKVGAVAAGQAAPAAGLPPLDPVGLFGVLAMVFPVAVMFAAAAFTVALFAKSYKEAQSYLAPMMIVVIMPAVIGMLPGIDLNARLALVPLLNLSLVCREMLSGVWHWNYIALIFGSSCLYAGIALTLAVRMFKREDVIFRA